MRSRALAEPRLLPAVARAAPLLRELLAAPGQPNLEVRDGSARFAFAADLTDQLRSLAAIALCELAEPFEPPAGLAHALRVTTDLELATLGERVRAMRADGTLPALLDRVEASCRAAMDVPAELRWPALAERATR
jgi:hypothetical protein